MLSNTEILEAVNSCLVEKGSRKFAQSVELIVNFRGVDFNKTENRLNMDVILPKGRGKEIKIAAFAEGSVASDAKAAGAEMIVGAAEIQKLEKAKVKQMAKGWEFVVQPQLMMPFGKSFGQVLAGKGKSPRPLLGSMPSMFSNLKRTVKLRTRGKNLPNVQCAIGSETMPAEDLAENIGAVISALTGKYGEFAVRSVMVKLSMGKPCKIGKAKAEAAEEKKEE